METLIVFDMNDMNERSYRTYEEWKHSSGTLNPSQKSSSYRTYEEWKPTDVNGRGAPPVEFLPYL